nr:Chain B, FDVSWFMG peptide [Homo sapiens]
FDVSWFM